MLNNHTTPDKNRYTALTLASTSALLLMDWIPRFPGLSSLEEPYKSLLLEHGKLVEIPENTRLFGPGTQPDSLMLLLEGSVRVHQVSESGREIVLYRINAGESCIMTTACLLAFEDYSARGIAECDLQAIAISRDLSDRLLSESRTFREFVFGAFAKRITDLFAMVEEVAFQRVDVRLAQKLIELAGTDTVITTTHQHLAVELGTAREVISRQLREFQRREWIHQSRGAVELLDIDSLTRLAAE
jgi:CRP/FNR family transcriptional regulator